jgi:hypothetical protein
VHESRIIRQSEYDKSDPFQFRTPTDVIQFTVVQLEGKAKQPADDFARGYAGEWVFEGKKQYI